MPSTATYYLAENGQDDLRIIMGGLASKENIIAQLITLKLAGVHTENIEIVGDIDHFTTLVKKDIEALLHKMPELKIGKHPVIVAGCGMESTVNEIIKSECGQNVAESQSFKGHIISLIHTPLSGPVNGVHGFVSLHLNYGEITEKIVSLLLENCDCRHIFTGGAGGYIPKNAHEQKPEIGRRIAITQCMNELGEIVIAGKGVAESTNNQNTSAMHLQIPSIFLETYQWLDKARQRGTSVDVETFYIMRAIQNYNSQNPTAQVQADCGYFISDYVGEKPLREYSKVYQNYAHVLSKFLKKTLA